MRVNADGTGTLVRAAFQARVKRFIFVSTDEVYGQSLEQVSSNQSEQTFEPQHDNYIYDKNNTTCLIQFTFTSVPAV